MKAYLEKDNVGRPIWRVKYFVAKRRVRKTFHSLEDANTWIDNNREIATEEGRIFWEAWYGINSKERHDLLDALTLMRAHWLKHPESKLTMVEAARNQIALVDSVETSLPLQEAIISLSKPLRFQPYEYSVAEPVNEDLVTEPM